MVLGLPSLAPSWPTATILPLTAPCTSSDATLYRPGAPLLGAALGRRFCKSWGRQEVGPARAGQGDKDSLPLPTASSSRPLFPLPFPFPESSAWTLAPASPNSWPGPVTHLLSLWQPGWDPRPACHLETLLCDPGHWGTLSGLAVPGVQYQ